LVSPVGASCVAFGSAVRSAEDCDGPTGVAGTPSPRPASLAPSCRRPERRAPPGLRWRASSSGGPLPARRRTGGAKARPPPQTPFL